MKLSTTELINTLGELILLLNNCGERKWAKWLQRDHDALCTGNTQTLEHLLSAYGGMGSINDVYFCPENKYTVQTSDVDAVNEKFRSLSSQVYSLAQNLKRNVE